MTKKFRRTIFYIFLGLFIILALGIVLYAQGYGFSWQKKSLVTTGAFYFKSQPKEAQIIINDKPRGETNKFIKRLLPKEYKIEISKQGYHSWQKKLEIKPKLVTAAKNILLIKKNPEINFVAKNDIKYFSISPSRKNLAYLTPETTTSSVLKLLNLADGTEKQIYPPLENGKSLLKLKNISEISWSDDSKNILLTFSDNRYYLLQLPTQNLLTWNKQDAVKIININELIRALSGYAIYDIHNLHFNPQDSSKIYFLANNQLYVINLNENSLESIISEISTYTVYKNILLYIRSQGVYKTNLEGSSLGKLFEIPLSQSKQNLEIISDNLLTINSRLYFFNPQTEILEKIASNIEEANFSEDGQIFFWKNKNKIGVIWMEANYQDPTREKYEIEAVIETEKDIQQTFWYPETNQHLIFYSNNSLKIIELDDRDQRNIMTIANLEKASNLVYNQWNSKIYGLNNNRLFEIKMSN